MAIGAYVAYVVSQFLLLGLSRAREYGADHWSCECTGDGDALASALVKVAYGMGQVKAAEQEQAAALVAAGKQGRAEAAERQRTSSRIRSMRAMGIFEPRAADELVRARSVYGQRPRGSLRGWLYRGVQVCSQRVENCCPPTAKRGPPQLLSQAHCVR